MPELPLTLRLLLCAVLVTVGACKQTTPATEVIVVVHADSDVLESQLSVVKAQLYPVGATRAEDAIEDRTFSLATGMPREGKLNLPFSFVIEKGESNRFLLVVTGYRAGETGAVIEHKVTASFQERRTMLLEIVLSVGCLERANACAGLDETCHAAPADEGTCGAVSEAPVRIVTAGQELDASDFGGGASGMDAGTDADEQGPEDDDAGSEGAMGEASAGDGGTAPGDAQADAGDAQRDAGPQQAAIASSGAACSTPDAKACNAHNGRQKLICFNGQWSPNGSCDGDTRCQTQIGSADVGICLPIVGACAGKLPGDVVCDGVTRRSCGADLLDYASNPCPAHASCSVPSGIVTCTCDSPYMSDGAGACTTPICMQMPCQNSGVCSLGGSGRVCDCSAVDYQGASCETKIDNCQLTPCAHGGACTDGVRSRSCVCVAGSGFTGSSCADNVNECASSNVCSGTTNGVAFSYPCVDSTGDVAGYTCRGQFPDWAVPTSAAGRFSAAGGVVTDSQTGLRWQQTIDASTYTWANANTYCMGLSLAGAAWRLPTRAELLSIVDYAKYNPAIDEGAFPGTPSEFFWASPCVACGASAWVVSFGAGVVNVNARTTALRVRCVR